MVEEKLYLVMNAKSIEEIKNLFGTGEDIGEDNELFVLKNADISSTVEWGEYLEVTVKHNELPIEFAVDVNLREDIQDFLNHETIDLDKLTDEEINFMKKEYELNEDIDPNFIRELINDHLTHYFNEIQEEMIEEIMKRLKYEI